MQINMYLYNFTSFFLIGRNLEDHPRTDVSGDRITPHFKGIKKVIWKEVPQSNPTRSLGDLQSACLLTTTEIRKSWMILQEGLPRC